LKARGRTPNPPLAKSMAGTIMADASRSLGYHPFQAPSSNASEVYTNFEGQTLGACEYCGHCERFGCEANAKASPNVCILPALLADSKFELRTHAQVKELVYDKAARKVMAVRYVDTRSGKRRRRNGTTTPSRSARRAATMRTAKISWISIQPIAMRLAGRSFACRIISATTILSSRTISAACSGGSLRR
jgi:choline dehydrogenase-like flavoprotein